VTIGLLSVQQTQGKQKGAAEIYQGSDLFPGGKIEALPTGGKKEDKK